MKILASAKLALLGACSAALFGLSACGDAEVEINYKLDAPADLNVYVEGYYSSIDSAGLEQMGTITAAYVGLHYESAGDTLRVRRDFQDNKSRGYLKNFMPSELAWRVGQVNMTAVDREVIELSGLEDGYDTLLNRTAMPTRWRNDLLRPEYKPHLKRLEKHRWEMDHLLVGKVPKRGNITKLLEERGRLNFALIKIDSVVTDGFHNLDKRKCLGYTVYLSELESFPYYIWEQHVSTKIVSDKYITYSRGLKTDYQTQYWVTLDPATGLPCQEREVKVGINTMVNPNTNDTATFENHVTLERLYTLVRPEKE